MKTSWIATTALLLLPSLAGAETFEYGVRSGLGWTNNVFGTSDNAETTRTIEPTSPDHATKCPPTTPADQPCSVPKDLSLRDSMSVRMSPWGRIADPDGDVTWSIRYQPSYEYYFQESDISGFDHDASADGSWRIGSRTTLFASESYQQFHSLLRFNENASSPTNPQVLRNQREKIQSNLLSLGIQQNVTPRDLLLFQGGYDTRDYSQSGSTDRWTGSADAIYRHSLSERTTIGAQASWIRQNFDRSIGDAVVTDYYNISGLLDYHFSRTLSFQLSAGPTWINGDNTVANFQPKFGATSVFGTSVAINADDCPLANDFLPHQPDPSLPNYNPHVSATNFGTCGVSSANTLTPGELQVLGYPQGAPLAQPGSPPPRGVKLTAFDKFYSLDSAGNLVNANVSSNNSDFTYFARAALIKDWEKWHAELAYERSNDDSGSFGTSSVQDSFEIKVKWQPAELWTIALTGAYTIIDQATDVAVPHACRTPADCPQVVLENGPVPVGVDSVSQIATVQRLIVDVKSNAVSYDTQSVTLAANRQLTEHSSVFAALYYYGQQQHLDIPNNTTVFVPSPVSVQSGDTRWNTLTLWLGLDWQFDTFKF